MVKKQDKMSLKKYFQLIKPESSRSDFITNWHFYTQHTRWPNHVRKHFDSRLQNQTRPRMKGRGQPSPNEVEEVA